MPTRVMIYLINGDTIIDTMEASNVMDLVDDFKTGDDSVLSFTRSGGTITYVSRGHIVKIIVSPEED